MFDRSIIDELMKSKGYEFVLAGVFDSSFISNSEKGAKFKTLSFEIP